MAKSDNLDMPGGGRGVKQGSKIHYNGQLFTPSEWAATRRRAAASKKTSEASNPLAQLWKNITQPINTPARTPAQMKAGEKAWTSLHGDPQAYARPTIKAIQQQVLQEHPELAPKKAAAKKPAAKSTTGPFNVQQLDAIARDRQTLSTPKVDPVAEDPGYQSDPSVAKAIAAIGNAPGMTATKFSGSLKGYIDKYKSMMPTTDYGSLIKNAGKQADTGDKKIQGFTSGLQAYIGGLDGQLANDAKENADLRTSGAQSAVALLNSAYDASRKSVSDQLAAIGGLAEANPDPGNTTQQHQQAAAGDIASRLQSSLDANASDLSSRQAFTKNAGVSAGMQGLEARSSLQRDLAKMVAQYRTSQSQENASNALQAMNMGNSQYNSDRSYAQSEAARAQEAANAAYSQRVNAANMAISADNQNYSRYRDTVGDQRADAQFQFQVDQANKPVAAKSSALPAAATQLWSNIYGTVYKQTKSKTQAQAAANTAVKNAGY